MIKKYLIIIVSILVIAVITLAICYNYEINKPQNIIERTLNLKLPSTSKIIRFTYYNKFEEYGAKISFEDKDIRQVKKQLDIFFKGASRSDIAEMSKHYRFGNSYQWWDLNFKNVESYYRIFVAGKNKLFKDIPKSYDVFAFISKDKNNQYYLYIIH